MRLFPFVPCLSYAETHYSFRFFPSRLRKAEPEVVLDVPHRLEPGQRLPVLVLVKDAHLFPIELCSVEVELITPCNGTLRLPVTFQRQAIKEPWWHTVLFLPRPEGVRGPCQVRAAVSVVTGGERRTYVSDNYRLSTHAPLACHFAEEPLPRAEGWHFGDLHCHSAFTSDQVEFGAPIAATLAMAKAQGLSFFAITDHSYDLDDSPESALRNDHRLPKWHQMQAEVARLNAEATGCVVIPGEELSCGNRYRRNVHLLVLDNPDFLEGAGDSAERWLRTRPELSVAQALSRLRSGALAYAAHPEDRTPLLQWLLIRRGRWTRADYRHPRLNGLQLLNGHTDVAARRTLRRWVSLLLAGQRLTIVAGNDGHGNFARFRQIGLPFLTMREHCHQIFGAARTGVLVEGELTLASLKAALRQGKTLVTTGPFLELRAESPAGTAHIGGTLRGSPARLVVTAKSTAEFGPLHRLTIWLGKKGARREEILWDCNRFPERFQHRAELTVENHADDLYVRGELSSRGPNGEHVCYTNPIWLTA
ncbi:MAG: CehA/McbA family metallohydrolase [Calditrichaeota bacterium]|nr:CehA/McbA family metallohydrolase [Calditrichota bacterium]